MPAPRRRTGEILAFTDDDCAPDREWLVRLGRVFADGRFAAAGGPNLPPPPRNWREAVVCAAPGAPSHVMLDDEEAEHLPGCNLVVTKAAFEAIGGFDPVFHTGGDDVDFCWRLREAGFRLGFAPGAFVWHWRRSLACADFSNNKSATAGPSTCSSQNIPTGSRNAAAPMAGIRLWRRTRARHGGLDHLSRADGQGRLSDRSPTACCRCAGSMRASTPGDSGSPLLASNFSPPACAPDASRNLFLGNGHQDRPRQDTRDSTEFAITPPRDAVLNRLLAEGWTACGPHRRMGRAKTGNPAFVSQRTGTGWCQPHTRPPQRRSRFIPPFLIPRPQGLAGTSCFWTG